MAAEAVAEADVCSEALAASESARDVVEKMNKDLEAENSRLKAAVEKVQGELVSRGIAPHRQASVEDELSGDSERSAGTDGSDEIE